MHSDEQGENLVEELEKRLRDAGAAGFVQVTTQKRAHWRLVLDAPWTAFSFDRHSGQLDLKLRSSDFRSLEQARDTMKLSLHALFQLRDICFHTANSLNTLCESVSNQLDVEHNPGADFQPPRITQ